jgi:hypothetical protein
MSATICVWTDDCIPSNPMVSVIAVVLILILVALAINDYIGDD